MMYGYHHFLHSILKAKVYLGGMAKQSALLSLLSLRAAKQRGNLGEVGLEFMIFSKQV